MTSVATAGASRSAQLRQLRQLKADEAPLSRPFFSYGDDGAEDNESAPGSQPGVRIVESCGELQCAELHGFLALNLSSFGALDSDVCTDVNTWLLSTWWCIALCDGAAACETKDSLCEAKDLSLGASEASLKSL